MLRLASETSFAYNPLITQTTGRFIDSVQDVLICNSEGLWVTDRRVRTRISGSAVASSDSEKQTGTFSPGAHMGFEHLEQTDIVSLAKQAARTAVTMLGADVCPSGKMPVVIENGFGGVIFHEACGHSLEATSVAKGASVFAGKLGQTIASGLITAVDDGTLPNNWGSQHIDDEGAPTCRNILIENGVLKSYMIDRLNGIRMNAASTGSSRRESYRFAPTSRMTNTFIAAGASEPDDIISATEYGIYAKEMGGGSVSPATGEFNFAVSEGYMIRGGKIAEPVRGATLIGKGHEVLMNIDMVGNNLKLSAGMCGSQSGSVPTKVGQPRIRVSEMIVGGRNDARPQLAAD
jgi:TldD protein